MGASETIREALDRASAIRLMFEEANRLREKHGEGNVHDLSLGNPVMEPPNAVRQALRRLAIDPDPGSHRYMPNQGRLESRQAVASRLARWSGTIFDPDDIVLTVGAAGGLSVFLKTVLNPGDEVLGIAPYFPEYPFYVESHGGTFRPVDSKADFHLDPDAIARALTPRTRALILNSPNNPTGRMYDVAELEAVASRLQAKGGGVYLVSDEPYRRLVYGGRRYVEVIGRYPRTVLVGSHSKDLALPGERLGWVALSPDMAGEEREELVAGMAFCQRALGFVNAPALMQRLVTMAGDAKIDMADYRARRDMVLEPLRKAGYEVEAPDGAFYLFPRSPLPDDWAFCRHLMERHRIICVPGAGFGRPGHFRIAFCVDPETIEGAVPGLKRAIHEVD